MQMTISDHDPQECGAIAEQLARLGDRWTLPVVVTLRAEPLRFNRLRRTIPGISQQMLTRTLRMLERDGMVSRTVHPTVPPQVEYALTTLGISLAEQALSLGHWIQAHLIEIDRNRSAFDVRDSA